MGILSAILGGGNVSGANIKAFSIKNVIEDYTLEPGYNVIEVNVTNSDIILTLPTVDDSFRDLGFVLIKRVDDSAFDLIIRGTSGNYEDDEFILDGLEGTTIYPSNSNFWRSTL